MKRQWMTLASVAVAFLAASPALGQQPELPKPGPEHAVLAETVGSWECTVKPEGAPESKGTSVSKMALGGLWLCTEFVGDFAGMPFEGRGLDTFDPDKKQYRSIWVDSFGTSPVLLFGDYDKATKTLTMTGKGPGTNGAETDYKSVTVHTDKDHQTFKMYTVDGGKEALMLTIDYARKK
ncbi:MAG: DUF1579 domain-containing protein [Planctomycetia bacterium]|nr:DUF1579 domain-containing protein [Planctomycetia bacterium]